MKNKTMIIVAVVAIVVIAVVVAVLLMNGKGNENGKTKLPQVSSVEDLSSIVDKVYEGVTTEMFNVQTITLDLTDENLVESYTGLASTEKLEYAVVSEPMINAQPYSLVMAKVKDGVNASEVAKEMSEKINTRKWICVTAEQLYATNSGDIVFLIMTDKEKADSVYDSFKKVAGTIGEEYPRTTEDELPLDPDTDTGVSFPVPD